MNIVFGLRKLEQRQTALLLDSLGCLEPSTLPIRELESQLRHMATPTDGPSGDLPNPYSVNLSLDVVEPEALESLLEVLRLARARIIKDLGSVYFTLLFVQLIELHTLWAIHEHHARGEMAYAH